MKILFYSIVETITENITGITNGEIKIWEFGHWMEVSEDVTIFMNLICAMVLLSFIYNIYDIVKVCMKEIKQVESE